jgi:hypothetical protein
MKNLNMYQNDSDSYLKKLFQLIVRIGKPYKSPPGFEYLRDLFSSNHMDMMNDQKERERELTEKDTSNKIQ